MITEEELEQFIEYFNEGDEKHPLFGVKNENYN